MTTNKEDMILKKMSEEIEKAIMAQFGSLQDCCGEATLAFHDLLSDEDFCIAIGLYGCIIPERIVVMASFDGVETGKHEYVRIDGIDYDPTEGQYGDGTEFEIVEENADFPPRKFVGDVSKIIEDVKTAFRCEKL